MKLDGMKKEKIDEELKKTIKVRALGDADVHVGYYNHLRRRGGDVFILRPIIRERLNKETKKKERVLITAEQQFSEKWMTKVDSKVPVNAPTHFNKAGRNRPRYDVPGMTRIVGDDDRQALRRHDNVDPTPAEEAMAGADLGDENVL